MSVSATEGNSVGSELFGGTAHAAIATWHVGLFTASPTSAGLGTNEVSGGSYARVAVTNNATNFPATSALTGANGTAITFPTCTVAWGTVTHVGLCASTTEGASDVRHFGALAAPVVVTAGQTPSFAIGALTWTLA